MLPTIDPWHAGGNWEGSLTPPDSNDYQIDWLIETDSRAREIVLTAECECGHTLTPQYFDHPDTAFEEAETLTCPDAGTEHHTD